MHNPFSGPRRVRYFTPGEANALLPSTAARLKELAHCVQRYQEVIHTLRAGEAENEQRLAVEADELRRESQELLDEITEQGIEVTGIAVGQLEFPALRNGQEVSLSWRQGESRLEWWRPSAAVADRERLDYGDLSIWEWCS